LSTKSTTGKDDSSGSLRPPEPRLYS